MKKLVSVLLVVLVLGIFNAAVAFADGDVMYLDSYSATITTSRANVRVEPDEFAKKIKTFKNGEVFTVIGEHDNGAVNNNWYIISCDGKNGYIRKFVTVLNPMKLISTSEALYVFANEDFDKIIAEFATPTEFLIIKEYDDYYSVSYSVSDREAAGFILKDNPDIYVEEYTGK